MNLINQFTRRLVWLALPALLAGCESPGSNGAATTQPVLKTSSELAAERARQIAAGQISPGSGAAAGGAESEHPEIEAPAAPGPLPRGSVHPDILLVNESVLTAAEVLYPLWDRLDKLRTSAPARTFVDQARRMIHTQAQQDVGLLLLHDKAVSGLSADQKRTLDTAVEHEMDDLLARDYGGSRARCEAQLAARGLTLEQFKVRMRRQLVAQQYAREELLPQVRVTRADLLAEYRRNESAYGTPGTRELWMIEAPFAAFVEGGLSWSAISESKQAAARLRAVQHIRAAHAALGTRSFEDVAREFSRGVNASQGGNWGMIGQPLQAPYDQASGRIFQMSTGQYSEPIETPIGWYIVRCGQIQPAVTRTFAEVQEELRQELNEQRFNELLANYIIGLADQATVSSLDSFVVATLQRALAGNKRPMP